MSSYKITQYSKDMAKIIGVNIYPSKNPDKKIDVYMKGKKLAEIGDINYPDFPSYINTKGLKYALKRRELFYSRNYKFLKEPYSPAWLASRILWIVIQIITFISILN